MRRLSSFSALLALLIAIIMPAAAQDAAPPPPDERPPAVLPDDDGLEPQITIRQQDGNTIEEYRVNGKLYKVRVIPTRGVPYFLVDQRGDGSFVRADGPGSPGLSVPMWVIGTF